MKDIYTQEEVERVAQAVIDSVKEKMQDQIVDSVHDKLAGYLYEHYDNNKDRLEEDLIKSITEEYVQDPTNYKYSSLRKKMYLENKDELTKVLNDESIYETVSTVLNKYTHRDYHFNWQWKDNIARFLIENIELFKDDVRVNEWIARNLKQKDTQIAYLKEQLGLLSTPQE